jgi:hypothetical protein
MKDLDEITENDKEDFLKQIQNHPDKPLINKKSA